MRGLKGKRVLITGGASGIGAATAARFLEEGSAVVVLDRDGEARKRIQEQLPDLAGTVDADVSNLKQVESAFNDAVRLMGGVDVMVNNAGISIRHNFLDITPQEWDITRFVRPGSTHRLSITVRGRRAFASVAYLSALQSQTSWPAASSRRPSARYGSTSPVVPFVTIAIRIPGAPDTGESLCAAL